MPLERAQDALDGRRDVDLAPLAALLDEADLAGREIDLRPRDEAFFQAQRLSTANSRSGVRSGRSVFFSVRASRGLMTRGGRFFSFIWPLRNLPKMIGGSCRAWP
jgi:hypothetical protein